MKTIVIFIYVLPFLAMAVKAEDGVSIWEYEINWIPVSIASISDEVRTDKDFTELTIYKRSKKIAVIPPLEVSLQETYEITKKNEVVSRFVGKGQGCILLSGSSEAFLVYVEKGGELLRIAPLIEIGDGWSVPSSRKLTSKSKLGKQLWEVLSKKKSDAENEARD